MKQCYKVAFFIIFIFTVITFLFKHSVNLDLELPQIRIFENSLNNQPQNCTAAKNLIFAKTHKTGSSTLQNIFLRYGWTSNLTFVVPKAKTWMFSFKQKFKTSFAHQYKWNPRNIFSFFTFHSIWNLAQVRKLVPNGPVITILRDPVDVFESGYVYMGLEKRYKMDINSFAKQKLKGRVLVV